MLESYKKMILNKKLRFSLPQYDVISYIFNFYKNNDKLYYCFKKKKSIYLYGNVGIGKSLIMSLFYNDCKKKKYIFIIIN